MHSAENLEFVCQYASLAVRRYRDLGAAALPTTRPMLEGFAEHHARGLDHLLDRLARHDVRFETPAPTDALLTTSLLQLERELVRLAGAIPNWRLPDDVRYALLGILGNARCHAQWLEGRHAEAFRRAA